MNFAKVQTMNRREGNDNIDLETMARDAMRERNLLPDFGSEVKEEVRALNGPARESDPKIRDLRDLLWSSIDNDDSLDLDQLTSGEKLDDGKTRILIAIADVDALVAKGSAIDRHARHNTTSVYVPGRVFPMLPERLSTDLTSLNPGEDRLAVVTEVIVDDFGHIVSSEIYRAIVHNKAKLAYDGVDAWLDGRSPEPDAMKRVPGLADSIRLQNETGQRMRERRHELGALDLRTIEAKATVVDHKVVEIHEETENEPKEMIEDFMVAANGVSARFLDSKGFPSLRRIVREPERWDRIMRVAEEHGERLPDSPDAQALEEFLIVRRKADPLRFPDLSLTIVKLLGSGEYAVARPGSRPVGHFGLAVKDYSHSTAPNRRYPDLITQRLLKAALAGEKTPYTVEELEELAAHCTDQEDEAEKVERMMRKAAAALLLQERIGEKFDAIVTGASGKGTWVRILHPPVEGKVVQGHKGLDVGDKVKVKLLRTNPERGFIYFAGVRR